MAEAVTLALIVAVNVAVWHSLVAVSGLLWLWLAVVVAVASSLAARWLAGWVWQ